MPAPTEANRKHGSGIRCPFSSIFDDKSRCDVFQTPLDDITQPEKVDHTFERMQPTLKKAACRTALYARS